MPAMFPAVLDWSMAAAGAAAVLAGLPRSPASHPDSGRRARAGAAGERRVARTLDAMRMAHVDNVTFECRGRTVQVDHVVDLGDRLLAIETKQMAGTINARRGRWVQCRPGQPDRRFQSPVEQNAWHCRAVSGRFGVGCDGLVVFAGSSAAFRGGAPRGVVGLEGLPAALEAARGRPRGRAAGALAAVRRVKDAPGQAALAARHVAGMRSRHDRRGHGTVILGIALACAGLLLAAAP